MKPIVDTVIDAVTLVSARIDIKSPEQNTWEFALGSQGSFYTYGVVTIHGTGFFSPQFQDLMRQCIELAEAEVAAALSRDPKNVDVKTETAKERRGLHEHHTSEPVGLADGTERIPQF